MNWTLYKKRLKDFQKRKVVYIFPIKTWWEQPLYEWFEKHYSEFGFTDIAKEKTPKYLKLKEIIGFKFFPDFLVLRDSKWLRLEVETFSNGYLSHKEGYADILLCYDETTKIPNIELITLKDHLGYIEIINKMEIPHFLYHYDLEFRKEYDRLIMEIIEEKMGASLAK